MQQSKKSVWRIFLFFLILPLFSPFKKCINVMTIQTGSLCVLLLTKKISICVSLQKTLNIGSGFSTLERFVHIFLLLVQFKSCLGDKIDAHLCEAGILPGLVWGF